MKRILNAVAVIVGLVVLAGGTFAALNWPTVSTFPAMPSGYDAKEYCSCRWVMGRDESYCAAYVTQSIVPMQGREVDEDARVVTSRSLWVSATARYVDTRVGCALSR